MTKKTDTRLLWRKLVVSWRKAFNHLLPFGGVSFHNHVQIIHDGDEAFARILDDINVAERSVNIEMYTFAPDAVGLRVREALLAAKARGVVVNILYDHLGSASLTHSFLAPMTKAGIKVLAFNPFARGEGAGHCPFAIIGKIIVIDERVAFCGA